MNTTSTCSLGLLLAQLGLCGCTQVPPTFEGTVQAGPPAGVSDTTLTVYATVELGPEQIELRTLPELDAVDFEAVARPGGDDGAWVYELRTVAELEERWYVVLWAADDHPEGDLIRGGTTMDDGARAWRVFGRATPELQRFLEPEENLLRVEFTGPVELGPEATGADALTVSQDGASCLFLRPGGTSFDLRCDPALDWAAPIRVTVSGVVSAVTGLPVPDTDHSFGGDADSGREHVVASALTPPPFPAALCASCDG
ncbi:MAG: hypothetical protein EVA89_30295 [Sandaracinaceae bacterium]|nr:MAG: hypothetical protein EVA89_30295 [Sandaracinaceae bacterium]